MPRLLGVDIPAKKKVAFSLRYINGIGPARADLLVKEAGLDPAMRAQDLTEEQLNKILHIITEHKWVLEGDKGGKPADGAAAPAAGAAPGGAPAAEQKPVEMVHGVAKQPTAEDLLKEELGAVKVRKAKGSKNVTSGVANVLASFNNTIV